MQLKLQRTAQCQVPNYMGQAAINIHVLVHTSPELYVGWHVQTATICYTGGQCSSILLHVSSTHSYVPCLAVLHVTTWQYMYQVYQVLQVLILGENQAPHAL